MSTVFFERRPENEFIGVICDHPFPSHVHDVVEIVCLFTGSLEMTIAGKKLLLLPGDIAVAFPVIPHSYDYVSPDARGLTLIFSPDTIVEFFHTFRTMLPISPLLTAAEQPPALPAIIQGFRKIIMEDQNSPLKQGYLHLFLSYLFSCLAVHPVNKHARTSMSYQVLQYISEHFTEPLTLESTAHALGISRIHLSHIFSQQLHINFRQYINTLRIDRAQSLLRNPSYSISQIAYLCGYGNQRTFHRAFLSQCGMTPNRFRATLNTANQEKSSAGLDKP